MPSERETHRTSDGFLTVRALRSGAVDTLGWKQGTDVHLARLILFRELPEPPLFRVEHHIVHNPDDSEAWQEVHRELFDDVRKARRHLSSLRKNAPSTYTEPETQP